VRTPRLRTLLLLPALAVAALVLAGCGTAPHYDLAKTRTCLKGAGFTITPPPADDFVARSALVGAFRAFLPEGGNAVTLSFGEGGDDAKRTSEGYVRYHAQNVGVFDVLDLDKNVVLLWKEHPSDADRAKVKDCLK
jgi:hypothetical protein